MDVSLFLFVLLVFNKGSVKPATNSNIVKKALIYFGSTTYLASVLGKYILYAIFCVFFKYVTQSFYF